MGVLLILLGLLGAVSGGVKLRARARSLHGVSRLAVWEAGIGVLTVLAVGVGLARMRPLAWVVVVVENLLIFVSSIVYIREAMRLQKKREASEAERLASHLGGG